MSQNNPGRKRLVALVLLLSVAAAVGWFFTVRPRLALSTLASAPLNEVKRRVRANPDDFKLVLAAAARYLQLGDPVDALVSLARVKPQEGTAASTDQAAFEGLFAEAKIITGQPDIALAAIQRALTVDASCIPAYFARGLWFERQARWQEASTVFSSLMKAEPGDKSVLFHLASDEMNDREYISALDHLTKACALAPAEYPFQLARAADLAYLGRFGEAVGAFTEAQKLNPNSFEARANVVRARAFAANTPNECRQQEEPVSQLLSGDPDRDLDEEILGLLELHARDTVGAQYHLEAAALSHRGRPVTLDTLEPSLLLNLQVARALNGQDAASDQARVAYNQSQQLFSDIERLKTLIIQHPENVVARLQLARLYDQHHANAEAIGEYEELLHLHAFEVDARARRDALAAIPEKPEPESAWAWRVLRTETGMAYAGKRPART